ncbi:Probable carboxyvinyl-carboxyphosphonate phosphorylmutase [hydrothermal vent metagenome]|uniref:Probable carboxyvinyl-carboxyphosphonate phosphorylmutase n=1 Tax=hydrothermal vent metagenome TaxID=652676 RepID=A0A3B1A3S1_9ZZZZ
MTFKNLHNQNDPLLICNVWDVASTKIAEKLGFQAIGTSSAAIATLLGYEDGENMSFSELRYLVKRIIANTKLPLTVDLESGYSRKPSEIIAHIKKLVDLGVVGINIEDSIVNKERTLLNTQKFAKTISTIKEKLKNDNIDIFLNVRTDIFLLGQSNPVDETIKRIQYFEKAGADGIFIPCIEKENDIKMITGSSKLPINVMCMPNLPNFDKLKQLGVKRISMGNFLFDYMSNCFEQTLEEVLNSQSFNTIF